MPIVNVRNSDAKVLQSTDFLSHQDHFVGIKNLDTIARNGPAIIDGWIMSNIGKEVAGATAHVNVRGSNEIAEWTNTTNTCAALTNPGANIFRHGLIGMNRLGETVQRGLFVEPSVHNSRTYSEGWSTTQGLWTMVGLYLDPAAVAPTVVTTAKAIFAKFRFDSLIAQHQLSWSLDWRWVAALGAPRLNTSLSSTGNSYNGYLSNVNLTVGTYIILGFIYTPGTSVTTFVNTDYRTVAAADLVYNGHPAGVPAALTIASATPITIGRWQVLTAGSPTYASGDAYYHFCLYGHAAITINQWLAMYNLVKPALGWNTALGGV